MHDFFHGWRRKLGLVTLSLACLTVVAWMRSSAIQDWWLVRLPDQQSRPSTIGQDVTTGRTMVWLSSTARYGFTWSAERSQSRMSWVAGWHSRPTDDDFDPTDSACTYSDTIKDYRWQFLGFEAASYHGYDQGGFESFSFWRVSYPSVVLVLTLASLWLLFPLTRKFVLRRSSNPRSQSSNPLHKRDRLEDSTNSLSASALKPLLIVAFAPAATRPTSRHLESPQKFASLHALFLTAGSNEVFRCVKNSNRGSPQFSAPRYA